MVTDAADWTLTPLRTTGRTWSGTNAAEPQPIAQIESVHTIEQATHSLVKELIRPAREARRSWYEIGDALDLHAMSAASTLSFVSRFGNSREMSSPISAMASTTAGLS